MAGKRQHEGGCHCGNVTLVFGTDTPPESVRVRECACSFCRKHGVRSITDTAGEVSISIRKPGDVVRYRFGLKTAEFLVCRDCGVYVAAVLTHEGGRFASVNLNALSDDRAFTRRPLTISYEGESAEQRIARRRAKWTPVTSIAPDAMLESKE